MGGTQPVDRFCVIGAGPAGLAVAERFAAHGVPFDVVEQWSDVGGQWDVESPHSSVCRSTHLITSKRSTEFPDFPMPAAYPDYPGHALVLDYLRDFAKRFDLYPRIEFGRRVDRLDPRPDRPGWTVRFAGGEAREHAGVVVATGHHWDPVVPDDVPGTFSGRAVHAADYLRPDGFDGATVLVVGLGNSASDVAVDAVNAGARVLLSVRTGNHVVPKYLMGMPSDRVSKDRSTARITRRLPRRLRRRIEERTVRALAGSPEQFGLPAPPHAAGERVPVVSSLLPYHLGHGDIAVKPPVAELRGPAVGFADGTEEDVDVIVWCTGYRVSLPFLDTGCGPSWVDGHPELLLNLFHPDRDDLFLTGLVDSLDSWTVYHRQGELLARYVAAHRAGAPAARALRDRLRSGRTDPPAAGGRAVDRWLFKDDRYTDALDRAIAALPAGSSLR